MQETGARMLCWASAARLVGVRAVGGGAAGGGAAGRGVRLIKHMPPRPKLLQADEDATKERFIHGGSGAGGQKINKTSSKVQLTHLPTGIVVTSQATRLQMQNRKIARGILAQKLEDLRSPEQLRTTALAARAREVAARQEKRSRKVADRVRVLKEAEKERQRRELRQQMVAAGLVKPESGDD